MPDLSIHKITVPGSLMLFGEHAVLSGHHALSCAIDKYISVTLTPRSDDRIIISSSLGTYEATLSTIKHEPALSFVTQSIQTKKTLLSSGFSLEIISQFSHLFGLGSSAAVTVATLGALFLWLEGSIDKEKLFSESLSVIRTIQGTASGADVAASVFGGIVFYRMEPCTILPLPHLFPLTVVYSGSKMKTKEVISRVQKEQKNNPALFDTLFSAINDVSERAREAICKEDWEALGTLCNIQQGLMDAIGVSSAPLSEIVYLLRNTPGILGSKISGSGLGDSVIGLGSGQLPDIQYPILEVQMSAKGISYE